MGESVSLVLFRVDRLTFGVEVGRVQEVLAGRVATRVPLAPSVLHGLINLRGEILLALDMRRRLGLEEAGASAQRMNLVVRGVDGPVSLLVDEIGEVVEVALERRERIPETLRGPVRELTVGVHKLVDAMVLVLDVDRTVNLPAF